MTSPYANLLKKSKIRFCQYVVESLILINFPLQNTQFWTILSEIVDFRMGQLLTPCKKPINMVANQDFKEFLIRITWKIKAQIKTGFRNSNADFRFQIRH